MQENLRQEEEKYILCRKVGRLSKRVSKTSK